MNQINVTRESLKIRRELAAREAQALRAEAQGSQSWYDASKANRACSLACEAIEIARTNRPAALRKLRRARDFAAAA